EEELLRLFTVLQKLEAKHSFDRPTFTLSISMVWELARTLAKSSNSMGCRKNYAIVLIYDSSSWTKQVLIEIAELSAIELVARFSDLETICGYSPGRRHRMDLQMDLGSPSSSTMPEGNLSPA